MMSSKSKSIPGKRESGIEENNKYSSSIDETTFINTHIKGWRHGIKKPYSVIKYNKVDRSEYGIMQEYEEAELSPVIVFDEIEYEGSNVEHQKHKKSEKQYNEKENLSVFSPYFSIPNVLFSVPKSVGDVTYNSEIGIPQLCFQNYFDVNSYSYVFGGLYANMNTLENYGIPLDTDPSKISVYLSSEVPTHVNKDVLMSPYIVQHTHFFKYNALRKVIIYLDTLTSDEYPGNINELMISRISDNFFFFYGGFSIKDEYSGYRKDIDRWIIKRKLVLNENGYILNLDTLKFTKINFNPLDDDIKIARIGCGIVSSDYKQADIPDLMARVPSPPIFADIDEIEEAKDPKSKDGSVVNNQMKNLYESSTNSVKYTSTLHSSSESTRSGFSTTSIGSVSSNTKSSIFAKSSKLFHRHSSRSTNHSLKSPQLQGLKNSYSNHVNKDRSNSFNSSASRPASPFQLSQTQTANLKSSKDEAKSNTEISESEDSNSFLTGDDTSTKIIDADEEQSRNVENDIEEQFEGKNPLFDKINSDVSKSSILVFIFGGFIPEIDDDEYQTFNASNDLLRIELVIDETTNRFSFSKDAQVIRLNSTIHNIGDIWPSPRGYFAYTSADRNRELDGGDYCLTSFNLSSNPSTDIQSTHSSSTRGSDRPDKTYLFEKFFYSKSFIIQGGANENYETFSDFFVFDFQTCTWQLLSTYAYNYFDTQIQPYEDDDVTKYSEENKVLNPKLEDAELRACHHSAIFYKADDNDYIFFFGGFGNDYLRLFDKKPYTSDKLDVTRLSKFSLTPTNTQILRLSILNLQTQTWRFLRYYYDMERIMNNAFLNKVSMNKSWVNARLCNIGSTYSISENVVTIGHGLIVPVAEKKEDMEKLKNEIPSDILLSGARVCFTIPNV